MAIADSLLLLNNTKSAIKSAIEAKGVTVGPVAFGDYASKIAAIPTEGEEPEVWVRPADWLVVPAIGLTEQKFIGLIAVYNDDSNYVALIAQGAYTVDWGDGVVQNFASGARAEHRYTYASLPAGSISTRGYKQALVTVTPQGAADLTYFSLGALVSPLTGTTQVPWLELSINGPELATFTSTGVLLRQLEKCAIGAHKLMSCASLFSGWSALVEVSIAGSTANILNMTNMFAQCSSLLRAPYLDLAAANTCANMFGSCYSLLSVDLANTGNVLNCSTMFSTCRRLEKVVMDNTSKVTNMNNMFGACNALKEVVLPDTSKVTDMANMFSGCIALRSVVIPSTASVTAVSGMFNGCTLLEEAPAMDLSKVLTCSVIFASCTRLRTVPAYDLSAATGYASIFGASESLTYLPLVNVPALPTIGGIIGAMTSLRELPVLDFANATAGIPNNYIPSITRSRVKNIKVTHSYANCRMQEAALNEVYTNLGTASPGATITVTGNPGASASNKALAIAKGWTVVA